MDQDAFRKLLASRPPAVGSSQAARGSLLPAKVKAKPQQDSSLKKEEFKPRKVKKAHESAYRDRAAERRKGLANDFAEAETLLADFEKQHADDEDKEAIENQRRYLGGDAAHTVLVKGLDFALLEQAKARAAAETATVDDDALEAAFRGEPIPEDDKGPSPDADLATTGKKRTREEIVAALKAKGRNGNAPDDNAGKSLEEAKKEGKFKPIGFKPIGNASKAKDGKDKEGRKKKKRKVEVGQGGAEQEIAGNGVDTVTTQSSRAKAESSSTSGPSAPASNPEISQSSGPKPSLDEPPPDDEFDIFAGAGEYEGLGLGDDEEESDGEVDENAAARKITEDHETGIPNGEAPARQGGGWFADLERTPSPPPSRDLPSASDKGKGKETLSDAQPPDVQADEDDAEHQDGETDEQTRPIRLAPLATSAVPSIKDILAADSALEVEEKRRARKEKRKAGKNGGGEGKEMTDEAKLNRDYQKLQAYTKKKGEKG